MPKQPRSPPSETNISQIRAVPKSPSSKIHFQTACSPMSQTRWMEATKKNVQRSVWLHFNRASLSELMIRGARGGHIIPEESYDVRQQGIPYREPLLIIHSSFDYGTCLLPRESISEGLSRHQLYNSSLRYQAFLRDCRRCSLSHYDLPLGLRLRSKPAGACFRQSGSRRCLWLKHS
ncbi:hypothetical protein ARMSODRAFT_560721 [Armillaria solidipes]|uniref:Uncharacterized protein n=1 Tax=Armillaria solidipes TaxID=1076256 RepID=A0A2H3AVI1_9AGAR|nr:hypothetical protein ARMSODRAFT_610916 [Armillaria solidipes]PBK62759.1 hypothetical protein ARMSODRAFT_560721 [Armillaria solidipes]